MLPTGARTSGWERPRRWRCECWQRRCGCPTAAKVLCACLRAGWQRGHLPAGGRTCAASLSLLLTASPSERFLGPQIGLPGYSSMPAALAAMPRQERATYCNAHWGQLWRKVHTLEFSRWVARLLCTAARLSVCSCSVCVAAVFHLPKHSDLKVALHARRAQACPAAHQTDLLLLRLLPCPG